MPEFPPSSPKYPATPIIPLTIGEYTIKLKDESYNPTGSHKDRWAWEQLLGYKRLLQLKLDQDPGGRGRVTIPTLCMISAGGAAYALQNLLRLRGLPALHVVIDEERVGRKVTDRLRSVGAVVHPYDLDHQELDEERVRGATGLGTNGIDITTRRLATPGGAGFYDWLVCEILLEKPSHIFVPYGSGDLYANIMAFLEKEAESKLIDDRLHGVRKEELKGIHLIGATTNDCESRMDKLFAKFRPTWESINAKVAALKGSGLLGQSSGVLEVTDSCAEAAMMLARGAGIRSELSGAAALGLFLEKSEELRVSSASNVVVVNTGWLYTGH